MSPLHTLHQRLATAGPRGLPERLLYLLLCAGAALYRSLVCCRLVAYRAGVLRVFRSRLPVVSVGNLAVGGTGKTPMVDLLLRWAASHAVRVAVVSRGYGGAPGTAALLVSDGRQLLVRDAARCGDEPLLLARRNPAALVIVARRRALGVQLAERLDAQLVILDDGFQHLAVFRDLDIVLLDSARPFGNGRLLPAGILREPPGNLARADIVVLTRNDHGEAPALRFSGPVLRAKHHLADEVVGLDGTTCRLAELAGRPCAVFAGIAQPSAFFQALRERGVTPVAEIALADHQRYQAATFAQLAAASRNAEFFLTTEKDAVKFTAEQLPLPCYRVPLNIAVEPLAPLMEKLSNLLTKETAS